MIELVVYPVQNNFALSNIYKNFSVYSVTTGGEGEGALFILFVFADDPYWSI